MNKTLVAVIFFLLGLGLGILGYRYVRTAMTEPSAWGYVVDSFEHCVAAGNPIMESYPRQCRGWGRTFTEEIGNTLEKSGLIVLDSPRPNDVVKSPLTVRGKARGTWYFEATFPIVMTNWDGLIIGQGYAQAKDEWMTNEFVPFEGTIEFETPSYGERGSLILQKDNPSGLPEHDDALEIPVRFAIGE